MDARQQLFLFQKSDLTAPGHCVHWCQALGSGATAPPPTLCKENTMTTPTPQNRRWLRKFWGAVCVIAGLVSIAAGLESVILE